MQHGACIVDLKINAKAPAALYQDNFIVYIFLRFYALPFEKLSVPPALHSLKGLILSLLRKHLEFCLTSEQPICITC